MTKIRLYKNLTELDLTIFSFIYQNGIDVVTSPKEIQRNIPAPRSGGELSYTSLYNSLNRLMANGLIEKVLGHIQKETGYIVSKKFKHTELTHILYFNKFIKNRNVLQTGTEKSYYQHSIYGLPDISDLNEYEQSIVSKNIEKINRALYDLTWLQLSIEIRKNIDRGVIPTDIFHDDVKIDILQNIWENAMEWPREFDSSNDIYDKYDQDFKQGYGGVQEPIYQVLFWISCKTGKIFDVNDFEHNTEIALLSTKSLQETEEFQARREYKVDFILRHFKESRDNITERTKIIIEIVSCFKGGFKDGAERFRFINNKNLINFFPEEEIEFMSSIIKKLPIFRRKSKDKIHDDNDIIWYLILKREGIWSKRKLNDAFKKHDEILKRLCDSLSSLSGEDVDYLLKLTDGDDLAQAFFHILKETSHYIFEIYSCTIENYDKKKGILKIEYKNEKIKLSSKCIDLLNKAIGKRKKGFIFSTDNFLIEFPSEWRYSEIIKVVTNQSKNGILKDYQLEPYVFNKYQKLKHIEKNIIDENFYNFFEICDEVFGNI